MRSHEVELVLEVVAEEFVVEDFGVELGALFGVLEDARNLDGAGPIDVVEALAEDEFLQHALLHLRVRVDHAVVVGHGRPAVRRLRHHVEVVVVGHNIARHQRPCRHVPHIVALREETFGGLDVDHDHGDGGDAFVVDLAEAGAEDVDVEVLEHGDLVARGGRVEDQQLGGRLLVSREVGSDGLQRQRHHRVELLLRLLERLRAAEDGGEGGVDSGTHPEGGAGAFFDSLEGEHHGGGQAGGETWDPEGVAAFGDDLEKDLGGDALQVLLLECAVSGDLADHLVVQQRLRLHLLVLRLHRVGQDDQADIALLSLHRLLQHRLDLRQPLPVVEIARVQLHRLQLHAQVAGRGLEGIEEGTRVLAGEVDDAATDGVLAGEDRLIVEVEEGLLALLDRVVLAESDARHGDQPPLDGLQVLADLDPDLLEGLELVVVPQLPHQLEDLAVLLIGRLYGVLGDLLAAELVEVFGNAGHEAEFGEEVDLELLVAAPLAFDTEEGLFGVADGDVVLGEVVLAQRHACVFKLHAFQFLEDHFLDLVVAGLAVVGHHDLALQLALQDQPLLVLLLILVELVNLVNHLQHRLVPHDLLRRVHPQVVPVLQQHKVRPVSRKHHQIVDGGLL